jgi:hypothetical protein
MAANYYDSALLGFQGRIRKGLAANEVREKDTMVLQYALDNTQFFESVMNVNEIKKSVQRPVYGYQFNRITTANGSGMVTQPTGTMGTSVQVPLTFFSFTQTFQTFNVTGLDNVFQFGEIFDNQASQAMRQLRTGIREWLTNNLYINRTTVLPYGVSSIANATFDSASATYLVNGQNPYSKMTSVMRQASYGASSYDALFDPTLYPQFDLSAAQGTMNATNLQYQFAKTPTMPAVGGYFDNIWEDLNLANDQGYNSGYALVMPKNAFAFVPWMPANYYAPGFSKSFDQYVGGYGTIGDDKYDGMTYQIFGWNNQSDTSGGPGSTGSNGYAQSQTQNWQIGFTAAFVKSELSNTGESPIYGFAVQP